MYKHCKAFIFPSFYEGFGIPPMEALCMGAPIVISDIPVLRQIYKGAAHYINPCDFAVKLDKLIMEETMPAQMVLSEYSWDKSAGQLVNVIGG
ncbi:MAG: glycosyltransferase, partial [Eubacteriales bacterium]|nr:glycosyltransferase [Eubacteriales bacterium]